MSSYTRRLTSAVVLASGVSACAGCHPTGVETVSDLDTVATAHDSTFSFATPTTSTRSETGCG